MNSEIICQITEEEWEFKQKDVELNNLETQLAQAELELATFRGELDSFQARYICAIGSRYFELDEIEAEIAEIEAQQNPDDQAAQKKAQQAKAQAKESKKAAGNQRDLKKTPSRFKPTESLKKLYRQIAKRIHPDLALNDQERVRYQKLMAKANQAYQTGDEIGLQSILRQCKKVGDNEKGEIEINKLARIIRKITQIQERLSAVKREKAEIRNSSLYQLKTKVEKAEGSGIDLLAEMARVLDHQIQMAIAKLEQMRLKGNGNIVS
ncbi:MAG TPA: molecular chaperone DnaJ [Firmicutes bacterium]|nr:molecular chaperone DnaJ [Bacillota bacterium]